MTPRTPRLLPLTAAILALTTLTLTQPLHAQLPAPCTLLTPTQIKTVLTTAGGPPTSPFWVPHPYAHLRMGGVEGASSYDKTCRAI
jgi:hypothetical protein